MKKKKCLIIAKDSETGEVFSQEIDDVSKFINDARELERIILKIQNKKLKTTLMAHRNKKGKEWRDELLVLTKNVYMANTVLNKTAALKTAFEELPGKEKHREEFDTYFQSIYRKIAKLI